VQSITENSLSNLRVWPWKFDPVDQPINQPITQTSKQYVSTIQFHPSGHVLCSGLNDGSIKVYDFTSMLEADETINQSSNIRTNNQSNNPVEDQSINVEPICVIEGKKAKSVTLSIIQSMHHAEPT
jgi:WD40 repeat protein